MSNVIIFIDVNLGSLSRISNVTEKRCCVGLSMDLLKIFSQELNFDFHIKEVEDGKWGALNKVSYSPVPLGPR